MFSYRYVAEGLKLIFYSFYGEASMKTDFTISSLFPKTIVFKFINLAGMDSK